MGSIDRTTNVCVQNSRKARNGRTETVATFWELKLPPTAFDPDREFRF